MTRSAAVLAALLWSVGCAPRQDPPLNRSCAVSAAGASQIEQLETVAPAAEAVVRYFLDVDAGGPLACRPGNGFCDPCTGAVVELPIGEVTTVVVEVQPEQQEAVVITGVELSADSDDFISILSPLPEITDVNQAAPIFVGIAPSSTAEITGTVLVSVDAANQDAATPFPITLRARGVEPR